jgi:hypothetical protein
VGSRVLGAASACVVASGLFLYGLGGALALAEPSSAPEPPGGTQSDEVPGTAPKTESGGSTGTKASNTEKAETGTNTATETDNPSNGGNPGNGNCGNDGSNGNAEHCGDPSPSSSPSVTSPTKSTTETPTATTTETEPPTSTTEPPAETTTSDETTTSRTTTTDETTTTETTDTTTPTTTTRLGLPPPGGGGGGGGGGAVEVPLGPPEIQLPPAAEPSVLDVLPGVGAAAAQLPVPPITLPVIVAPMGVGLGGGGGAPAAPRAPSLPSAPRGATAQPPAGREPLPARVGSNVTAPPSSYRIGYTDYLRNAGLSQVAALAVPGVAGMLVLTGAGGLVGYRQAKAGHAVHTNGTARFVS